MTLRLNENQRPPIIMNYLTLDQIFLHYPFIHDEMGWSREDLEQFTEGSLLIGKLDENDQLLIWKYSLENLIDYFRDLERERRVIQSS